jgi:hypothetical protein
MRKVIALLTQAVESGDRAARDGWEYFGSFGDDIFSDDADDILERTVDERRTTAARARLLTERRILNRSRPGAARRERRRWHE